MFAIVLVGSMNVFADTAVNPSAEKLPTHESVAKPNSAKSKSKKASNVVQIKRVRNKNKKQAKH